MAQVKVCDECQKLCQLLQPSDVTKSEWYCGDCHRSYPVEGISTWERPEPPDEEPEPATV